MRFVNYLTETYFTSLYPYPFKRSKDNDVSYEVFKNPDRKEITDLYRQTKGGHSGIRFYIDLNKKDVYIFYGDTMHHSFAAKMKINADTPGWIGGEGEYSGGKIEIAGIGKDIPDEDKKWLSKYFTNP